MAELELESREPESRPRVGRVCSTKENNSRLKPCIKGNNPTPKKESKESFPHKCHEKRKKEKLVVTLFRMSVKK